MRKTNVNLIKKKKSLLKWPSWVFLKEKKNYWIFILVEFSSTWHFFKKLDIQLNDIYMGGI